MVQEIANSHVDQQQELKEKKRERKAYTKRNNPFSVNQGGEVTGASTSHSTTLKI